MKYNQKAFDKGVEYYEKQLKGKVEDKLLFLVSDLNDKKAFFSICTFGDLG